MMLYSNGDLSPVEISSSYSGSPAVDVVTHFPPGGNEILGLQRRDLF